MGQALGRHNFRKSKPNSNQQSVSPTMGRRWVSRVKGRKILLETANQLILSCYQEFYAATWRGLAEWQSPWRCRSLLSTIKSTAYLLFLFIPFRGGAIMPVLLTKGLLTQGGRLSGSNGQEGLIVRITCSIWYNTHTGHTFLKFQLHTTSKQSGSRGQTTSVPNIASIKIPGSEAM